MDVLRQEIQSLKSDNQKLKSDITQLKNTIRSHETTNVELKRQLGEMAQKNLHLSQKSNTPTCKKCSGRC
jgi:predicted  nucleic acid-binding Zn-ribbon protein